MEPGLKVSVVGNTGEKSTPDVAESLAVAMSKLTPPTGAGALRLTVKE